MPRFSLVSLLLQLFVSVSGCLLTPCPAAATPSCPLQVVHPREMTRETREGWPLLTVETWVNGDSKSTNERNPSLVGSLVLSCRYKRFLFCLGCSSRTTVVQNIFFLTVHYIDSLTPSPSNLGMQPCWVTCLLVRVSGDDNYGKHWFRSIAYYSSFPCLPCCLIIIS